jgi:hypothetical protein
MSRASGKVHVVSTPMTCTPRWTGWCTAKTTSRPGWPPATWPRRRTRRGWRCSTVLLLAGRLTVPAGRPRLLQGRQERQAADRVRAAHRPRGRPVAVRVFPGAIGDPAAFTQIVQVLRDTFKLKDMVMIGDRGTITSARITALNQLDDGTAQPGPYRWITALRAPAIKKLMAEDGPPVTSD